MPRPPFSSARSARPSASAAAEATVDAVAIGPGEAARLFADCGPFEPRPQVAVAVSGTEVIDLEDLPDPVLLPLSEFHSPATQPDSQVVDLETVLNICGWNIARAARRLGVNRSTVHRRMERIGLHRQ